MLNYKERSDSKSRENAIGNKNKPNGWLKKVSATLLSCTLALLMLMPMLHAIGLEVGPEIGGEAVARAAVKAPTVNPVLYDATTISGGNLAKARINKKPVIATVHVSLKDSSGTEKATLSVTPKSGTTWKVDLPKGVTVAKGDTVTVYQQIGEDKSPEVTANAQPSKASTVTLTMPTGEIWIEQYVANIVNDDEKAEAIDLLKKANPTIAKDIKSVEFTITGVDPNKIASYKVTYDDNSVSEEIKAPGLTIKQVTETSRSPEIGSITIVDNVVKGKLAGPGPFDGIKVQLILNVNKGKADQYCNENKCTVDKDSSKPVAVTLKDDGTFSYTLQAGESLTLDQIVGVSVKEPHKFVSCSTTTVKPVIPEKTEVKDPRKLTAKDKEAIDAAIRKAYIIDGVSKLPNGTGDWKGLPAVIQFDDSGNAKIFSGNDVAGTWDPKNDYKFVPEKNEDGSYKLNDGAQPKITIQAKDLVKNIKPDAPNVALSEDKKIITITPNLEVDTDAHIITVSYKDKDGNDQTTTATKADDGTWSITGEGSVDQNGVITLPKNKVKGDTDVTATVKDKGGIADDDKDPLTSEAGTITVEETIADKVEALGGLDPVALKKWVKDTVDWKDGVKAKDSTKETEVNKLIAGATFTDETETKRSTDKSGDFEGKVKVKFSDDSEIIVEKQMLYVSDPVSPSDKENLPEDAMDVELKLGEGVKAGDKTGNKETPVTAKTYKVKPGTDLSTQKVSGTEKTCFEDVGATVTDDTYVDLVWNDKDKGTNFKVTAENNVFTATATKKFKVTVQPNGGTGDEKVEYKKSGENFTLPDKDTFKAPENQEFDGWMVGTEKKAAGDTITVNGDTEVKAVWKDIKHKVTFDGTEGSGNMPEQTVKQGDEYQLPENGFTAPANKKFAGWKVGNEDKKPGDKITVKGDTTVTAVWEDIKHKVTFDGTEGSGNMPEQTVKQGDEYQLPENGFTAPANKKFAGWKVGNEDKKPGDKITVKGDTTVTAVWEDIKHKVTFDGTEGSGNMPEQTVKQGDEYQLPENGFTAPANKKFAGWKVSNEDKKPGDTITVNADTEVKAIWEPIMVEISFDKGEGSGEKAKVSVAKGSEYTLPTSEGFTAPEGKEFAGWKVEGQDGVKKAGEKIENVTGNLTLTATWKKKQTNVPSTPEKPNPDQTSVIDREAGKDRIETSILISKQQYKKSRTVIIVRNDLYPDALTAGLLGKVKPAPILLTPSKMLDPRVEAEIRRLGATEIIIVGGKSAISLDVEKALAAYDSDTVERLDGIDRYETATLVARKVAGLVDIRQTAIITTGENWPDALSASAFACKNNHPILLVRKNKIDQVVNRTMKDLKIGQVYLVGGPMAVSETVAKKLPKVITRIAGLNRYGTAKAVAEYGFKDAKGMYLASGEVYADALIIGPVAGQRNVPILLTQHKHLNAETKAYIEAHKPGWITLVGGTLRIGPEVEKELKK